MDGYWLLVRSPTGERTAVDLGDADPGDHGLLTAVRAHLKVPSGDPLATGWDVQLTRGEPNAEWLVNVASWPVRHPKGAPDGGAPERPDGGSGDVHGGLDGTPR